MGSSRLSSAQSSAIDTDSVQPANISSESELVLEINSISKGLGPKVDWERRIAALKQLQGVAMGAGAFPNFPDLLRLNLREQLSVQIQDRRSQVLISSLSYFHFTAVAVLMRPTSAHHLVLEKNISLAWDRLVEAQDRPRTGDIVAYVLWD